MPAHANMPLLGLFWAHPNTYRSQYIVVIWWCSCAPWMCCALPGLSAHPGSPVSQPGLFWMPLYGCRQPGLKGGANHTHQRGQENECKWRPLLRGSCYKRQVRGSRKAGRQASRETGGSMPNAQPALTHTCPSPPCSLSPSPSKPAGAGLFKLAPPPADLLLVWERADQALPN